MGTINRSAQLDEGVENRGGVGGGLVAPEWTFAGPVLEEC